MLCQCLVTCNVAATGKLFKHLIWQPKMLQPLDSSNPRDRFPVDPSCVWPTNTAVYTMYVHICMAKAPWKVSHLRFSIGPRYLPSWFQRWEMAKVLDYLSPGCGLTKFGLVWVFPCRHLSNKYLSTHKSSLIHVATANLAQAHKNGEFIYKFFSDFLIIWLFGVNMLKLCKYGVFWVPIIMTRSVWMWC